MQWSRGTVCPIPLRFQIVMIDPIPQPAFENIPSAANGDSPSLRQLQARVDGWIQEIGVRYFSELTNLAVLVEEVGELARILARTYGDQSFKPSDHRHCLSDEMADVLFVLVCLANQTGVDLTDALEKNLLKKTERDRQRHANNPKLQ